MPIRAQKLHDRGQAGDDMANLAPLRALPNWLPDAVRLYIDHTETGQSLRALARKHGLHASTVLRHVRRCEMRRDDPLVDQALTAFHHGGTTAAPQPPEDAMRHHRPTAPAAPKDAPKLDDVTIAQHAPRLLRRLAEAGTFLAIAPDMDKAAVMRKLPDGRLMRMAVVDRALAQVFALKEWIALKDNGKVATYELAPAGRAELKARLAQGGGLFGAGQGQGHGAAYGMAEASVPFQHGEAVEGDGARRMRYNLAESPVAVLGRRRDKDGAPYLDHDLLRAAERLREDFELAQMGTAVAQNWEGFLTAGTSGGRRGTGGPLAPRDARARVAAALDDLGPDLGHIALRVCCYLEGVEEAEQRMGWAARSGKVVLRIALRRLARHYLETYGKSGPLIG